MARDYRPNAASCKNRSIPARAQRESASNGPKRTETGKGHPIEKQGRFFDPWGRFAESPSSGFFGRDVSRETSLRKSAG
ncbi:MAG TPA: hypothetical protein VLV76_12925 [Candidatus Acidoferrum sp.]|nr:hypothetical protein [Candidatus Acidoferrum sp.]